MNLDVFFEGCAELYSVRSMQANVALSSVLALAALIACAFLLHSNADEANDERRPTISIILLFIDLFSMD